MGAPCDYKVTDYECARSESAGVCDAILFGHGHKLATLHHFYGSLELPLQQLEFVRGSDGVVGDLLKRLKPALPEWLVAHLVWFMIYERV